MLAFSELTKHVYFVPPKGKKVDVTDSFDFVRANRHGNLSDRLLDFVNFHYGCSSMNDQEKENMVAAYIGHLKANGIKP